LSCLQQWDLTSGPKTQAHLGLVQPTNFEEDEFLGMNFGVFEEELHLEQR